MQKDKVIALIVALCIACGFGFGLEYFSEYFNINAHDSNTVKHNSNDSHIKNVTSHQNKKIVYHTVLVAKNNISIGDVLISKNVEWVKWPVENISREFISKDEKGKYVDSYMLKTAGKPVDAVQNGLKQIISQALCEYSVKGVGTTGSGRNLAGALVGADVVKNEITAHAVAASTNIPGVQTILEIGGQDSKIIILRDGIVTDFAMNTVCAAGTGSFLDHQAQRLNVPIEKFGETALKSENPARIAGRCGVFAESDLIHKQQLG